MKKSLVVASLVLAIFTLTAIPNAQAQCNVPAVVGDLIKKLKGECQKLEGASAETSTCTKKQATFLKLVDSWNSLVGNSSLRIGPRDMEWNTPQTGNLLAPGDRRFISQLIEPGKGVTITLKKRDDGRAECIVNICAVDLNTGQESRLATHTFESNAKVGETLTKSFNASQVGNKIIVVFLNGKGLATRFPYEFKAVKN